MSVAERKSLPLNIACSLLAPTWELVIPIDPTTADSPSSHDRGLEFEERPTAGFSGTATYTSPHSAVQGEGKYRGGPLLLAHTGPNPVGSLENDFKRREREQNDAVLKQSSCFLILREKRRASIVNSTIQGNNGGVVNGHHQSDEYPGRPGAAVPTNAVIGGKRAREDEHGEEQVGVGFAGFTGGDTTVNGIASCFSMGLLSPTDELEVWLVRSSPLTTIATIAAHDPCHAGNPSEREAYSNSSGCADSNRQVGEERAGIRRGEINYYTAAVGNTMEKADKWLPSNFLNQTLRSETGTSNGGDFRSDTKTSAGRSGKEGGERNGRHNVAARPFYNDPVPLTYGESIVTWHGVSTLGELCPKGLSFKSFSRLFANLIVGVKSPTIEEGIPQGKGTTMPFATAATTKNTNTTDNNSAQCLTLPTTSSRIAADLLRYVEKEASAAKRDNSGNGSVTPHPTAGRSSDSAAMLSCLVHSHGRVLANCMASANVNDNFDSLTCQASSAAGTTSTPPPSSLGAGRGNTATVANNGAVGSYSSGSGKSSSMPDSQLVPYFVLNQNGQPLSATGIAGHQSMRDGQGHGGSPTTDGEVMMDTNTFIDYSNTDDVAHRLYVAARALEDERSRRTVNGGGVGVGGGRHTAGRSADSFKVVVTPNVREITRQMMGANDPQEEYRMNPHTPLEEPRRTQLIGAPPPPVVRVDICLSTAEGFGQLNFATFHLKLAASPFMSNPLGTASTTTTAAGNYYNNNLQAQDHHFNPPLPPLPISPFPTNSANTSFLPSAAASASVPTRGANLLSPSVSRYLAQQSHLCVHHQQWSSMVPSLVGSHALLCDELVSTASAQLTKDEEMLSAFVVLLNEKKKKIRELLEAAQQQQHLLTVQKGQTERQKEEIEKLKQALEEEKTRNVALQRENAEIRHTKITGNTHMNTTLDKRPTHDPNVRASAHTHVLNSQRDNYHRVGNGLVDVSTVSSSVRVMPARTLRDEGMVESSATRRGEHQNNKHGGGDGLPPPPPFSSRRLSPPHEMRDPPLAVGGGAFTRSDLVDSTAAELTPQNMFDRSCRLREAADEEGKERRIIPTNQRYLSPETNASSGIGERLPHHTDSLQQHQQRPTGGAALTTTAHRRSLAVGLPASNVHPPPLPPPPPPTSASTSNDQHGGQGGAKRIGEQKNSNTHQLFSTFFGT